MFAIWEKVLLVGFALFAVWYFVFAFRYRLQLVNKGRNDHRLENIPQRILHTITWILSQRVVTRHRFFTGLMHAFVFWGFIVFSISTIDLTIKAISPWSLIDHLPLKDLYLSITDIFSLLVSIGVVVLFIRRFFIKPQSLWPPVETPVIVNEHSKKRPQAKSFAVLTLIFFLMISYQFFEAGQISSGNMSGFLPMGNLWLSVFGSSMSNNADTVSHVFWWLHLAGIYLFLILIPNSKHLHIITGTINVFLMRNKPYAYVEPMDFDNEEYFGAISPTDLNRKVLFDTFACIECGRCQDNCPAFEAGTALSPKYLIVNLREQLLEEGKEILNGETGNPVIGKVLAEDGLWACTTCGACMEVCPMDIEHIPAIIELRRGQMLSEGKYPTELTPALKGMETQANPWGVWQGERLKWAEGLEVKLLKDVKETTLLLWVGCAASFDDRMKKIAHSVAQILIHAGVEFAILGDEEKCTGDPARRTGNEYLFQMLAQDVIATLDKYKVKKILTICPHCYNVFKNEYPDLGGNYEVIHHSQFLEDLVKQGKITVKKPLDYEITFHDPCYLGRHNNEYDAPRNVIMAMNSKQISEMPRSRDLSFCCGAGGGRMWMEETGKFKVNQIRTREAIDTGASVIGTACPFCMRMLEDGKNELNAENVQVKDIAELLWEAIS